jgi:hypothetical protein
VFVITCPSNASFEEPFKNLVDEDSFYRNALPQRVIFELKSLDKSLYRAYIPSLGKFIGISERDLPKYTLVSDFA